MPLPLPNLDTLRWTDLVDEGRALIPRYVPGWTDHNIHDPGITLMELLAWLVEQEIYRANRVPDRHRGKFLGLIGYAPRSPHQSMVPLTFTSNTGISVALPTGITVATGSTTAPLRFRTLAPLSVVATSIKAVQSYDGVTFVNYQSWHGGPIAPWGTNPQLPAQPEPTKQPTFYLGFEQPLPQGVTVSFWLQFAGSSAGYDERERIIEEARQHNEACVPLRRDTTCPSPPPVTDSWCAPDEADASISPENKKSKEKNDALSLHHDVRIVWEYYSDSGWQQLDAATGAVSDDTRGFTLSGALRVTLPGPISKTGLGVLAAKQLYYLRCRLSSGQPDSAPLLLQILPNTVLAEQRSSGSLRTTLRIPQSVTPPAGKEPTAGKVGQLQIVKDSAETITGLALDEATAAPEVMILDYQPATASAPGVLTFVSIELALVGYGTGLPNQRILLPGAPIAEGQAQVWTIGASTVQLWRQRPDLDASRRTDADFILDATTGEVAFGDGERGRVVPSNALIVALYDVTAGAAGNLPAGATWRLTGADDTLNQSLLTDDLANVAAALTVANNISAEGGTDAEDIDHAAGRANEALWAHERLVELCEQRRVATLDQIERVTVLARVAPARASTLPDFERLALSVPGTRIARARAWAGIDPSYPCLHTPGTVTVIIVPEMPKGRPQPSAGLLRAVRHYLDRRRVIGTRLLVAGPQYLEVWVQATVRATISVDLERVRRDIESALDMFLDPLNGGPAGLGWPFGRDVYRSEILQVIDDVSGVDHVITLELYAGAGTAQCSNLCVEPTWLVAPGKHEIEVVLEDRWSANNKAAQSGCATTRANC